MRPSHRLTQRALRLCHNGFVNFTRNSQKTPRNVSVHAVDASAAVSPAALDCGGVDDPVDLVAGHANTQEAARDVQHLHAQRTSTRERLRTPQRSVIAMVRSSGQLGRRWRTSRATLAAWRSASSSAPAWMSTGLPAAFFASSSDSGSPPSA